MPSPPDPPPRPMSPIPNKSAEARNFAEDEQVNRLLTVAHIQFRRGQAAEAEKAVQEIIRTRPRDAAALELLADIRESRGDAEGAQAALKSALDAEPRRPTAEAKLARAALRRGEKQRMQEIGVAYAASDTSLMRLSDGSGKGKGWAILASALIPGLGQYLSGKTIKGIVLAALYFGALILLSVLPDARGLAQQISSLFVPNFSGRHAPPEPVSGFAWFLVIALAAVWLYAIIDAGAASTASNSQSGDQDGWKV